MKEKTDKNRGTEEWKMNTCRRLISRFEKRNLESVKKERRDEQNGEEVVGKIQRSNYESTHRQQPADFRFVSVSLELGSGRFSRVTKCITVVLPGIN